MTVGVGIVGAGFMGNTHANAYDLIPSSKLIAVADIEPDRASSLAKKHGAKPYASLEDMLKDPGVQVVDITLPTYLHSQAAVQAAEAGKQVICEKPMALTLAQADSMVKAARKNDVELMIAHVIRFWPEWAYLAEKIKSKEFGKIKAVRCLRLSSEPQWGWKQWLLDVKKAGGATVDLHIHDTDYITHILGRPKAVMSIGWINHIQTTYDYGRNVAALAIGGWFPLQGYPFLMSYECFLENATLTYYNDRKPTLTIYQRNKDPSNPDLANTGAQSSVTSGNISELGGYYEELKYFMGCLDRGEKPSRIRPEEARQSLEVCLAEVKSMKTGKRVSL